jgi:hypothetical protein
MCSSGCASSFVTFAKQKIEIDLMQWRAVPCSGPCTSKRDLAAKSNVAMASCGLSYMGSTRLIKAKNQSETQWMDWIISMIPLNGSSEKCVTIVGIIVPLAFKCYQARILTHL